METFHIFEEKVWGQRICRPYLRRIAGGIICILVSLQIIFKETLGLENLQTQIETISGLDKLQHSLK